MSAEVFTAIFPSNAQGHIFPGNTAGHYYTLFPQALSLSGQWEVGLKDISYVHNIQTIKDESLIIGQVEDLHVIFPNFESSTLLKTYNLSQHEAEWSINVYRQDLKLLSFKTNDATSGAKSKKLKEAMVKKYKSIERVLSMVSTLNRIGDKLWRWSFDIDDNVLSFSYLGNIENAFYFSKDLMDALHLQHQLFVPQNIFHPIWPSSPVQQFDGNKKSYTRVSTAIEDDISWKNKKFEITMLPLGRMKQIEFKIPNCTVQELLEYIEKHLTPYGLLVRRTLPKNDSSLTWTYKNKFEETNVAFIHFNLAMEDQLECKLTIIGNPVKFVGEVKTDSIKGGIVTIYTKEVTAPKYDLEKWSPMTEIKLPSKFYNSGYEFVRALNQRNKALYDYTFFYDELNKRFRVEVNNRLVVKMSESLRNILGFEKTLFFNEQVTAKRIPILDKNIHHFYVYCNIIAPVHVGGQQVQMLRYIPITNAEYGETIYKEFDIPTYHPLSVTELNTVEFSLYDDTGEAVHFEEGRTVITLMFRQVL